jgi:predicted DNA-binding transcriptional regulator AlpA
MKEFLDKKKNIEAIRSNGYTGDRLLKAREVLAILGIGRYMLVELIMRGELATIKMGKKTTRYFEKDVLAYLERLRSNQPKICVDNVEYTQEEITNLNTLCSEFI